MMKHELDALTGHESTLEEYEAVEAWYMRAPGATKEDAAKVWKTMHLAAARQRENPIPTAKELTGIVGPWRESRGTIRGMNFRITALDADPYHRWYATAWKVEKLLGCNIGTGREKVQLIGTLRRWQGYTLEDSGKLELADGMPVREESLYA